jgi:hypothetical protein
MQIWDEERPRGWMGRGKMIGQMYVAGFTSFEVHEPGGQDIGVGKRI